MAFKKHPGMKITRDPGVKRPRGADASKRAFGKGMRAGRPPRQGDTGLVSPDGQYWLRAGQTGAGRSDAPRTVEEAIVATPIEEIVVSELHLDDDELADTIGLGARVALAGMNRRGYVGTVERLEDDGSVYLAMDNGMHLSVDLDGIQLAA